MILLHACKFLFKKIEFVSTVFTLSIRKTYLSKQCRPRSDAAECGVCSGSTLFATLPAVFDTPADSNSRRTQILGHLLLGVKMSEYFG